MEMAHQFTTMVPHWINVVNNIQPTVYNVGLTLLCYLGSGEIPTLQGNDVCCNYIVTPNFNYDLLKSEISN